MISDVVDSPTALSPINTPPPLPNVSLPFGPPPTNDTAPAPAPVQQPARPFPSRTTSRPTFKRTATYDSYLPTPPPNNEPFPGAEPDSAAAAPAPQPGPTAKPAWDALRRKVLPTGASKASTKAWPILNPNDHSELVYHGHHTQSTGRATPTFATASSSGAYGSAGGRATPTRGRTMDEFGIPSSSGLARMVGAATGRRRKGKRAEPSVQQRFAGELLQVDALFRSADESSTSGGGLAAAAAGFANDGVGHLTRKRSDSDATRLATAEAGHKADPVQALRLLESILDRYRTVGALPDPAAVLGMLARPFLTAAKSTVTVGKGPLDKYDEALCDMALGSFERFCEAFPPGDGEEELERWRWMLGALEVRSDDLRVSSISSASTCDQRLTVLGYCRRDLPGQSATRSHPTRTPRTGTTSPHRSPYTPSSPLSSTPSTSCPSIRRPPPQPFTHKRSAP